MQVITPEIAKEIYGLPNYQTFLDDLTALSSTIDKTEILPENIRGKIKSENVKSLVVGVLKSKGYSPDVDLPLHSVTHYLSETQTPVLEDQSTIAPVIFDLKLLAACGNQSLLVQEYPEDPFISYEAYCKEASAHQRLKYQYDCLFDGSTEPSKLIGNVGALRFIDVLSRLNATRNMMEANGKDTSFLDQLNVFANKHPELSPKLASHVTANKFYRLAGFDDSIAILEEFVDRSKHDEDTPNSLAHEALLTVMETIKKMQTEHTASLDKNDVLDLRHVADVLDYFEANSDVNLKALQAFTEKFNSQVKHELAAIGM